MKFNFGISNKLKSLLLALKISIILPNDMSPPQVSGISVLVYLFSESLTTHLIRVLQHFLLYNPLYPCLSNCQWSFARCSRHAMELRGHKTISCSARATKACFVTLNTGRRRQDFYVFCSPLTYRSKASAKGIPLVTLHPNVYGC
jgi:hypothetical protein